MTEIMRGRRTETPILDDHVQHQFIQDDDQTLHANPLRRGLADQRTPQPCIMVIFGVTGDLTARKLMPALYDSTPCSPCRRGSRSSGSRTATGPTRRSVTRCGKRSKRTLVNR